MQKIQPSFKWAAGPTQLHLPIWTKTRKKEREREKIIQWIRTWCPIAMKHVLALFPSDLIHLCNCQNPHPFVIVTPLYFFFIHLKQPIIMMVTVLSSHGQGGRFLWNVYYYNQTVQSCQANLGILGGGKTIGLSFDHHLILSDLDYSKKNLRFQANKIYSNSILLRRYSMHTAMIFNLHRLQKWTLPS